MIQDFKLQIYTCFKLPVEFESIEGEFEEENILIRILRTGFYSNWNKNPLPSLKQKLYNRIRAGKKAALARSPV